MTVRPSQSRNSAAWIIPQPPSGSDITTHIQTVIDSAAAAGVRDLTLPGLGGSLDNPWNLTGRLTLPRGLRFHAESASVAQTTFGEPAFYCPPGADDVTVEVWRCYQPGARKIWSDYTDTVVNGTRISAYVTGVMTWANGTKVRGKFDNWRNAVRAGNWDSGTTFGALRTGFDVNITASNIDFGLSMAGQQDAKVVVEGSFVLTSGSPDPAHLFYQTGSCKGGVVRVIARDSVAENYPVQIKKGNGIHLEYIYAENCSSVAVIENPDGPCTYGTLVGRAITPTAVGGAGSVRVANDGTYTGPGYRTDGQFVDVEFAAGVTANDARGVSFSTDDNRLERVKVVYNGVSAATTAQSAVYVSGSRSHIGALAVRNTGANGVQGLRYAGGTGHVLSAAPAISGVTNAVVIDTGVTGTFAVDQNLLTAGATYTNLTYTPSNALVIRGGGGGQRITRVNRSFSFLRSGATLANITPVLNTVYAYPVEVNTPLSILGFGVNVGAVGATGAVLRFGLYGDFGNGEPGTLLLDAGTADITVTGVRSLTTAMASAFTVQPQQLWVVYVAQVAAGAALKGVAAPAFDMPAATMALALSTQGAVITSAATVTGALPNNFAVAGTSSVGAVAIGYTT